MREEKVSKTRRKNVKVVKFGGFAFKQSLCIHSRLHYISRNALYASLIAWDMPRSLRGTCLHSGVQCASPSV